MDLETVLRSKLNFRPDRVELGQFFNGLQVNFDLGPCQIPLNKRKYKNNKNKKLKIK